MAKKVSQKEGESKSDAFKRLGGQRLAKAIAAIGQLRHLGNKSSYEYTPEQVEKIEQHLSNACVDAVTALKNGKVTSAASIDL